MKCLCINQTAARIPRAWLKRWLEELAKRLAKRGHPGLRPLEVTVVFVEPREIKRLNAEFRGKDKVTDILSFASEDPDSLGELVLCLDVIRRQSLDTGLSERGELGYMLVHGVLHLLGYDHEVMAEQRRMFAFQDDLYSKLEKAVGLR